MAPTTTTSARITRLPMAPVKGEVTGSKMDLRSNSNEGSNYKSSNSGYSQNRSVVILVVSMVAMIVVVSFTSNPLSDPRMILEETARRRQQVELSCRAELNEAQEINDRYVDTLMDTIKHQNAKADVLQQEVKELKRQLGNMEKEKEDLEQKHQDAVGDPEDQELDREMVMVLQSEPMIAVENPVQTFRICSENKGVWGALILNRLTRLVFPKCNFVYNIEWRKNSVAAQEKGCDIWYSGAYSPEDSRGKSNGQPFFRWTLENGCEGQREEQEQEPLLSVASKKENDFCLLVPQVTTPLLNFIGVDRYEEFLQQPNQFIPMQQYASKLEKPYFLAYANSNCVDFRDEFFQKVLERTQDAERTHSVFGCLHNRDISIDMPDRHNDKGMFELYSDYKFIMALENERGENTEHYLTEQILRPMIAHSVPVYMGATELAKKVFNPKRIVFVEDFDNFEACIDYLMELDKDDAKYQEILAQPIFPSDGMHELLDFKSPYYKEAAQEARRKFMENEIYNDSPLRQCVADNEE